MHLLHMHVSTQLPCRIVLMPVLRPRFRPNALVKHQLPQTNAAAENIHCVLIKCTHVEICVGFERLFSDELHALLLG